MDQTLFNISVTVIGFLGGWWLKVLWDAVKDLQAADKVLVEKVSSIEILVAGNYITRADFDKIGAAISEAFGRHQSSKPLNANARRKMGGMPVRLAGGVLVAVFADHVPLRGVTVRRSGGPAPTKPD